MSKPRQDAREIYLAAQSACCTCGTGPSASASQDDLLVVEHILRAVIEVLTPEQRAEVLAKVKK
jgi:hypothetical protein